MADIQIRNDKIQELTNLIEKWMRDTDSDRHDDSLAGRIYDEFYLPTRRGEVEYVKQVADERNQLAFSLGLCQGHAINVLALVEEVIAEHADRVGTHYEGCWRNHAACLAVAVKEALVVPKVEEEPGTPER